MTLSSSLSAGVAGLSANATRLAVISDNIANASTIGYRRADVDFASLVVPSGRGSHTAGGVRASPFRDVATAGNLVASSNATDISVAGRGFLPVTTLDGIDQPAAERPFQLTATGSFSRDAEGYLTTRSGLALMGWPTDGDGTLQGNVIRDGAGDLVPVRVSPFLIAVEPTTEASMEVNVPASATEAGADGAPYQTVLEYYDGVGRRSDLVATFTPEVPAAGTSNRWTLDLTDNGAEPPVSIGDVTLEFDTTIPGAGRLSVVTPGAAGAYDPATGILIVDAVSGPIEVFIGGPGLDGGVTQLDAAFAPISVTTNGAAVGNLSSVEIDSDGFLRGIYDTGAQVTLFRIPVVDVPNANGLIGRDGQAFAVSTQSGAPYLWDANNGPVGGIQGFALQESTVDIAQELTGLIKTQRAYSSNATVIQTVDEMLQETTNLKR